MIPLLLLAVAARAAEAPVPRTLGAVVRSAEWVVRRAPRREEEFRGDVRYEAAGSRLRADWALYRHEERDWSARGDVRALRKLPDGSEVEARGESARHDEASGRGELLPAPGQRVLLWRRVPGEEPARADAARLSWDAAGRALLEGAVHAVSPRLELWADAARWDRESTELALTGSRPVLRGEQDDWTLAVKADEISARENPRRVAARGGAVGWLRFRDEARLRELAK